MHKCIRIILPLLLLLVMSACNTLKFVPEDKLLLNKTKVSVEDSKDVHSEDLTKYLQQHQNSEIFGFWKLQLHVYDMAGKKDNWWSRTMKKMGEAPEVFDEVAAGSSMLYLSRALHNMGYFNASVDTVMEVKKRKLKLTYNVTAGEPYTLRSYTVTLPPGDLKRVATQESLVKEGMVFDASVFDKERERVANAMRTNGYYYFEKDYLQFVADSAYGNQTVTAQMGLRDFVMTAPDSVRQVLFRQFVVSEVNFYTEVSHDFDGDDSGVLHEEDAGYHFIWKGKRLIRNSVLKKMCLITPGQMYNVENVERSYTSLNALGPVKYVDITFEQIGDHELACNIQLSKSKLNSVNLEVEGTFSNGSWGVAGGAGYTNRNLFRGAEEFNVGGSASYEWRQEGGTAVEAKAETSIAFTKAPKVLFSYQYQNRPDEFTRTIMHGGLSYNYHAYNSRWNHQFNLLDVSYVYLPWISDAFRDYFLQSSNILKYSYEDHFIMSWGYSGNFSSFRPNQPLRSYVNFNYNVETAGNALYGISKLFKFSQDDEEGVFKVGGVRFAQYAKGDLSFAFHGIMNEKHRLVFHSTLGVAVPFGNAASIPFEKRYFAGGANSVRGWAARTLGPGAYRGAGTRIDFNNQSGDIKMEFNLEYRWKVWKILELAAFTDAGNVWTIRDYETQPHGAISADFYKELAWSYGVGVRLDFSFFIFRVDMGVKLYDPSRIYYDEKQWRTAPNGLCWRDDFTFNFAIGHPF